MSLLSLYRKSRFIRKIISFISYAKWKATGQSNETTPHIVKQRAINFIRKRFKLTTLIETGTYLGDMIHAQKNNFQKLYTIELNEELSNRAKKTFSKYPHIKTLCGDSAKKITEILSEIKEPSLFWLDAHYSGGITSKADKLSPALEELTQIFKSPYNHIILFDDARCFNGHGGYPSIDEIENIIKKSNKNYQMAVENDIIFIIPMK